MRCAQPLSAARGQHCQHIPPHAGQQRIGQRRVRPLHRARQHQRANQLACGSRVHDVLALAAAPAPTRAGCGGVRKAGRRNDGAGSALIINRLYLRAPFAVLAVPFAFSDAIIAGVAGTFTMRYLASLGTQHWSKILAKPLLVGCSSLVQSFS